MSDNNHIDRLEQGLYSRKHKQEPHDDRSSQTPADFEVGEKWSDEDKITDLITAEQLRSKEDKNSLFKKILFGSVIFCILAIGVALFMFFGGGNLVSANNIDIQVVGPSSVSGGEELSLDVVIKNNNRADLEGVNLLVVYPDGTRVAGNVTEPLERQRETIGRVPARGEVRKTVKSVLFGEKESIKEISITLEYRIQGSSATFFKDKKYEAAIKTSPVIVTIKNPSEINSNQDIEFVIDLASNSGETLQNLLFKAEYPFGFVFGSADPKPLRDNSLWSIGNLAPNDKRIITIKGRLQGQNDEERTFRFSTGIANEDKQEELGATFSVLSQSVRIRRPFLAVDVSLGGQNTDTVVQGLGERIQTNVIWTNNLPNQLLNGRVEVKLSGNAFDKSSVSPSGGGYYRSLDSTIVWDKAVNAELGNIEPGERGIVGFNFSPLTSLPVGAQNEQITVEVTVSGSQINDLGKPEVVETKVSRVVKLASSVNLTARTLRSIGPFENSGPIPPRADQETTYTIVWSLTNSLNTVSQTRVRGELPPYVKWAGLADPAVESVAYDENTREVVWNVGDLRSGTGFTTSPREVAFQVIVEPSLSQVGNAVVILQTSNFLGDDRFTEKQISGTAPSISTRFLTDPMFRPGDEAVEK